MKSRTAIIRLTLPCLLLVAVLALAKGLCIYQGSQQTDKQRLRGDMRESRLSVGDSVG